MRVCACVYEKRHTLCSTDCNTKNWDFLCYLRRGLQLIVLNQKTNKQIREVLSVPQVSREVLSVFTQNILLRIRLYLIILKVLKTFKTNRYNLIFLKSLILSPSKTHWRDETVTLALDIYDDCSWLVKSNIHLCLIWYILDVCTIIKSIYHFGFIFDNS